MSKSKSATLENKIEALEIRLSQLEVRRAQRFSGQRRFRKRAVAGALLCLVGIPLLHAAVPNTFNAGTAAVAAEVNANFSYLDDVSVPIGGIIGWHRNITGSPLALPASNKWVECNGQVLADGTSPLNGLTIPNLNGDPGGVNSPGQSARIAMFLRGGATSGTGQTDAFQGHIHNVGNDGMGQAAVGSSRPVPAPSTGDYPTTGPLNDGSNGVPRTASETRPVNMSVVWIMRVK